MKSSLVGLVIVLSVSACSTLDKLDAAAQRFNNSGIKSNHSQGDVNHQVFYDYELKGDPKSNLLALEPMFDIEMPPAYPPRWKMASRIFREGDFAGYGAGRIKMFQMGGQWHSETNDQAIFKTECEIDCYIRIGLSQLENGNTWMAVYIKSNLGDSEYLLSRLDKYMSATLNIIDDDQRLIKPMYDAY